ncbi:Pol polyprotein [Elysia marginata]|uniref:Pol polyprotein n=1 Tax=Elysia marginata TaxID=1093978 RepID=A0AAV4H258_9GAST|nr:Pol polyprotein [Elysia marginata]
MITPDRLGCRLVLSRDRAGRVQTVRDHRNAQVTHQKLFLDRLIHGPRHQPHAQTLVKCLQVSGEKTQSEKVKVRNYRSGSSKWSTGVILQRLGPVSYSVRLGETVRHCHINQLQSAPTNSPEQLFEDTPTQIEWPTPTVATEEETTPAATTSPTQNPVPTQRHSPALTRSSHSESSAQKPTPVHRRYPRRDRKPVEQLDL